MSGACRPPAVASEGADAAGKIGTGRQYLKESRKSEKISG